jgi:hypothetical protein
MYQLTNACFNRRTGEQVLKAFLIPLEANPHPADEQMESSLRRLHRTLLHHLGQIKTDSPRRRASS